ncbi:MAG: GyrI-like domain-containing protein [Pseudomonadota bacterium]|nr:GyrI-like domain-containing protein [Pseudomonadota bacterium]
MTIAPAETRVPRIERAIALLAEGVARGDELPGLERLAAAANFSPHHFHRVYRALTGETVGRTVARVRMLRALRLLSDPAQAVTRVAHEAGYETPQAFARAFREALGASPSELRAEPARLQAAMERLAQPPAATREDAVPLRVEVVSIEPFRVAAMRNTGPYADLDQVYGRLFAWAGERGLLEGLAGLFGLPREDRRDAAPGCYAFDAMLGFRVPFDADAHAGIATATLGGGRYARVRHVGSFTGLEALTDRVLAHWLPASGESLRPAPLYHEYLDDPEQVPEPLLRTDIHIPLEQAP